MTLLLDTSVLIGDQWPGLREDAAVSVVSLAELHHGVHCAGTQEERGRRLQRLGIVEETFAPLPVTTRVAREWGGLAAAVMSAGGTPRTFALDLLIAATAKAHGATLITRDRRLLELGGLVDVREA